MPIDNNLLRSLRGKWAPGICDPQPPIRRSDPLMFYGRYFTRVVHAHYSVETLLSCLVQPADEEGELHAPEEHWQRTVAHILLAMMPGLQARILKPDTDLSQIADLIQKGREGARAADTASLKRAVLQWIAPGQLLMPPLTATNKSSRGFKHDQTGALICPAHLDWDVPGIRTQLRDGTIKVEGNQWLKFFFRGSSFRFEDPWDGFLRSDILVSAFKFIFTYYASATKLPKRPTFANASIHRMSSVSVASIVYIAVQVYFALSSSASFSWNGYMKELYDSLFNHLENPQWKTQVDELLGWWNEQIFPVNPNSGPMVMKRQRQAKDDKAAAEAILAVINAGGDLTSVCPSSVDDPASAATGGLSINDLIADELLDHDLDIIV